MGWKDDPIVGTATAPAIDIRPGGDMPPRLAASENPYSAGRYPLGRVFTVGDEATFRETDVLTGVEKRTYMLRVTGVNAEDGRVEINSGLVIMDMMGNALKIGSITYDVPTQFSPAEIHVGKKWRAAFLRKDSNGPSSAYYDVHIAKREKITVPAGEFNAFKLECKGWNMTHATRLEINLWLVPGLIYAVKQEKIALGRWGSFVETDRWELVSLRQQAIGL